jgi:leucyl-tRNA synthetase
VEYFVFVRPSALVDVGKAVESDDGSWRHVDTGEQLGTLRVATQQVDKEEGAFRIRGVKGIALFSQSFKMSKSRGNVINPDHVVKEYGADSLRVYEMFMGPLESVKPWQTSGIEGSRRFLDRVFHALTGPLTDACDTETKRLLHKTIKKVGADIEALKLNTAISAMMTLVKHLGQLPAVPREAAEALALMVSPFAPHLGEELWQRLGHTESLAYAPWPTFDPALVIDDTLEMGVQVNGKLRGVIQLPRDAPQDLAVQTALADPKVKAHTEGKTTKKIIYVAGKILNFIVG